MRDHALRFVQITVILFVTALTGGCVGSTSGQMTLPAAVATESVYFVERHPKDSRDLASTIAERMQARGLKATSGTPEERKPEHTYIVNYTDRWYWDMRMYLADLRIEVRDAKDQSVVGFGQSTQSSLKAMGKTHVDIVDAALNELFGATRPAGP